MIGLRIILIFLFALGCEGKVELPDGDLGMPDATPAADMVTMSDVVEVPDMPPVMDPACLGVTCPLNAECGRGVCWCSPGFQGDPTVGCVPGNPCADADCQFGATCTDDGACVCDIGFMDGMFPGTCEAVPIDDITMRTSAEVCARWQTDYPERAGVQWQTLPPDTCTPGELDPAFQLDAVRRVTLYRWLAGLPGVTTEADYAVETQACATALSANGGSVTNTIDESFECYSADAADGALRSSVYLGAQSPAQAVDIFVEDDDVAELGNRRWILNPEMGATAFGYRGGYTCMFAIDSNGAGRPQYIAYPNGVTPLTALRGRWMWASASLISDDATVAVLDGTGAPVAISNVQHLPAINFPDAIVWDMPAVAAGTYTVTITGLLPADTEVTYTVELVACP